MRRSLPFVLSVLICVLVLGCGVLDVCVPANIQDDIAAAQGKPSKNGPDLIVLDISWTDCYGTPDAGITSGQPYSVSVTVKNVGNQDVLVQFQTSLYYRDSLVGNQTMAPLAVNSEGVMTWTGLFESEPGSHSFRAVVDSSEVPGGDVYEVNTDGHTAAEANNQKTESMSVVLAKWSFMFFFFGDDTSIEFSMLWDFMSISEAGSSPDVSLSVMLDRTAGGDDDYGDWTTAKRFFVKPGDTPDPENALDDIGEINMGMASVIGGEGQWAFGRFRAENYAVFFHGHGGWGIGWDYNPVPFDGSPQDYLQQHELRDALLLISSSIGKKIDLVGFETCNMGQLEPSYYQCKDSCSVLMATAGLSWTATPFVYNESILDLQVNPLMSAEQLASEFLIDMDTAYGTTWRWMALSAVREDLVQGLAEDVDALADLLIDSMPSVRPQVQNARSLTRVYDDDGLIPERYADVIDFASRMKESTTDPAIQNACDAIVDSANDSVAYSVVGSYYEGLKPIAIYWPNESMHVNGAPEYGYWQLERMTDFGVSYNWDEFLGGFYDVTPPVVNSVSINSGAASTTSLEVTVSVSAADVRGLGEGGSGSGLYKMCFSEDNVTWGEWVPYASTHAYSLASGPSGTRTVFCKVKDYGGVESVPIPDTIEYIELIMMTVVSPNGGENWQPGSAHDITWTSSGIATGGVNVYLAWDIADYLEIVMATENDGSFSWAIPSDLPTRTDYVIWVQGSDPAYQDIYDSSDGYFTIEKLIYPPTAPRNLTASIVGGKVLLNWLPPADDGGELLNYEIFRWQGGGTPLLVGWTNGDVTSFTDNNVLPGKTYNYKIDARNSAGFSPYSNIVSIRVPRT